MIFPVDKMLYLKSRSHNSNCYGGSSKRSLICSSCPMQFTLQFLDFLRCEFVGACSLHVFVVNCRWLVSDNTDRPS